MLECNESIPEGNVEDFGNEVESVKSPLSRGEAIGELGLLLPF